MSMTCGKRNRKGSNETGRYIEETNSKRENIDSLLASRLLLLSG